MGEHNQAKLIDFEPEIKANNVTLPSGASLVISNSLTPSPKILTVGTRYNLRVVECRFGLLLLGKAFGEIIHWTENPFKNLWDLQTKTKQSFD